MKVFRFLIKIFIAGFIFFNLTACQSHKADADFNSKLIIVGTNAAYPPFELVNSKGEVVGFDIDMINEVGRRLGRDIVIKEFGFDSLILNLKKRRIDLIISGMSITPSRQREIHMIPYQGNFFKELVLVYDKDLKGDTNNLASFSTIAVQTGTFQEEYLMNIPGVKIRSFESTLELVMELRCDKSPVAVLEPTIADFISQQFPDLKMKRLKLPDNQHIMGYGIGVHKDNQSLITATSTVIQEMKEDGTIAMLEKRWSLIK